VLAAGAEAATALTASRTRAGPWVYLRRRDASSRKKGTTTSLRRRAQGKADDDDECGRHGVRVRRRIALIVGVGLQKNAVGQCNANTQSRVTALDAVRKNHVGILIRWIYILRLVRTDYIRNRIQLSKQSICPRILLEQTILVGYA
jgi:hypothetical protein